MTDKKFSSGFIAIAGKPNVGKSTLLNSIIGEKLVITSDKPQTTRNRIQGIYNLPDAQIIFVDTPGVHSATSRLNKTLVETAFDAIKGVDIIFLLVDSVKSPASQKEFILDVLKELKIPVILVINKVDLIEKKALLEQMESYSGIYPFKEVVPVSAVTADGVDSLVKLALDYLPEGPAYFPDDILTDLPERFVVAEMIREKVFRLTRDEIPYSTAVMIESFKEREDGLISINAVIILERASQKGIVIGKGGEMLKRIGSAARKDIEEFLAAKVFLKLFVKVTPNWSDNPQRLREYGY
ncbi:MAG: GTPase Era [Desulfuromonadales bacterium]|nr:GTPase Era [Desulfuromonadales bacterium]